MTRLPLLDALKAYDREDLRGDLSAGITVGVMLIPQGMAYALIAGLPPIYGLYAGLAPLGVYAVFGSSRQLAVGPVAMVSLLVAAAVAPLAAGDPTRYLQLTFLLAALVGLIQAVMGFARLGFLVTFLSRPVLSGFTSAAAVLIALNQAGNLLGVPVPRANEIRTILAGLVDFQSQAHMPTMIVGGSAVAMLALLKRVGPRVPGALVVVVLGTVAGVFLGLQERGVEVVGPVAAGLPFPQVPVASLDDVVALLPGAIAIALIGFMSAMAVAKVYASRNGYTIDPDQELKALGFANVAGAVLQAFPTTGGFGRSAVNADAGARTTVASLISAFIIALTLLFLTHLFYHLPSAVLSAVVLVAVAGLVDVHGSRELWVIDRRDFALMIVTFLATLLLGIKEGLIVGAVLSLAIVIQQGSRPPTAVLGRLPDSNLYRNRERWPEARPVRGAVVFRLDASLFYTNADYFRDAVETAVSEAGERPTCVVLDAYPINRIDSTGVQTLRELVSSLRRRGVDLRIAGLKSPVRDVLDRSGFSRTLGAEAFYHDVHDAVMGLAVPDDSATTDPSSSR